MFGVQELQLLALSQKLDKVLVLKQRDNRATRPQLLFGLADPKEAKVCLLR